MVLLVHGREEASRRGLRDERNNIIGDYEKAIIRSKLSFAASRVADKVLAAIMTDKYGELIAIADKEKIIPPKFSFNMASFAHAAEHLVADGLLNFDSDLKISIGNKSGIIAATKIQPIGHIVVCLISSKYADKAPEIMGNITTKLKER